MLGLRKYVQRKIMSVLAPLTGQRASGQITCSATGADVTLPQGCFGYPIIESAAGRPAIYRNQPVFVDQNPATSDGSWTVTSGGVAVNAKSVLGGVRHNFKTGTKIRWDPALLGLELVSDIPAAWTGGAEASGDGAVRRIVSYETLGVEASADLFNARVGTFPAIVVAWNGEGEHRRMGRDASHFPIRWKLYVVTQRQQGTNERGEAGLDILDLVTAYLTQRGAVDGVPGNGNTGHFSDPPTLVTGATRERVTPGSYIYAVGVETYNAQARLDPRLEVNGGDGFADWAKTMYDSDTATTPALPVIDEAGWYMPGHEP